MPASPHTCTFVQRSRSHDRQRRPRDGRATIQAGFCAAMVSSGRRPSRWARGPAADLPGGFRVGHVDPNALPFMRMSLRRSRCCAAVDNVYRSGRACRSRWRRRTASASSTPHPPSWHD